MDKLKMQSVDNMQMNIEKIQKLFPNAVTEVKRNGKVTLAVDFDVLKQELSNELIDEKEERYQMTWPDKKKSILLANTPVNKTLRPCKEESVDFDNTQNLYIEGDNLDVLKLLQETYLGKIKMIYIDPPYNTGNDFVYNDDFAMDSAEYIDKSGQHDDQGYNLVENTESNGRFHTDWLNMIYPRLKVAKDLLSDDGIIFISIDDNELDNLIKICNEIFGDRNFVSNIIWYKNNSKGNVKQISGVTEYILCYAKNPYSLPLFQIKKPNAALMCNVAKMIFEKNGHSIDKTNNEFRKWMKENHIESGEKKYNKVDETGRLYTDKPLTAPGSKLFYDIIHPLTKKPCKVASRGWAYKKESFEELLKSGHILFGKDETTCPYLKYYLDENLTQCPTSHIQVTANNAIDMQLLGFTKDEFSYPKPLTLIKQILSFYPTNDLCVLDFFSGSATTAHAVMQLNAEDGGNRKFIMVQLPEKCDEKSEVYKAGYKTICDIGKERIRRAGKRVQELIKEHGYDIEMTAKGPNHILSVNIGNTNKSVPVVGPYTIPDNVDKFNAKKAKNLDVGFRVFKLNSSNMKDVYYKPSDYNQNLLDSFENNIKEDRIPLDLLFQVMLDLGKPLSAKIEEKEIAGKQVFIVDDNDLIACFDKDVTEETVTAIAKLKPLYAVLRDSGLSSDSVGANFDQIFATYSPNTTRKVL